MSCANPDKSLKYGIDHEIQAALDAKFDKNTANELINWIAGLAGTTITANGDLSVLKSGVDLCIAINKLQPGTVAQINKSQNPFFQRENIKNFLEGSRKYGVRDSDLFVTEDLYSGNNYVAVLDCLRALNGVAQKKGATTTKLGISSAGDKNTDNFKFTVKATGDTNAVSKQTAGSVYQPAASVRSDAIIKSTEKSVNANAVLSKQTAGSVEQKAEVRQDSILRLNKQ